MREGGALHPGHRSVIVTQGHLAGGNAPGGAHPGPAGGRGRTNPQSVSAYPDRPRFWSNEGRGLPPTSHVGLGPHTYFNTLFDS